MRNLLIIITVLCLYYSYNSDFYILKDLVCIGLSIPMICPPHNINTDQESCVFCHGLKNIVYQDDEYLAFMDINPSAKLHFLVIPRLHIGSVDHLNNTHVDMLKRMKEIANLILKNNSKDVYESRMGFHLPPFNSVHHLHLHGIGKPFNNIFRAMKYPPFETPWWTSVYLVFNTLD